MYSLFISNRKLQIENENMIKKVVDPDNSNKSEVKKIKL
jgi:hypothetical protein